MPFVTIKALLMRRRGNCHNFAVWSMQQERDFFFFFYSSYVCVIKANVHLHDRLALQKMAEQ